MNVLKYNMEKLIKIGDAAKILGVDPVTIRRMEDRGKIKCIRRSNIRYIPESEIDRITSIKGKK